MELIFDNLCVPGNPIDMGTKDLAAAQIEDRTSKDEAV